jgi:predicted nucleic acid-binding protein
MAAPDLLFPECANVFRSRVLRRLMSAEAAREAFRGLRSLPLQIVPLLEISEDALDHALRYDLSVYDGCYSALAARLGVPLVTADRRLLKKLGTARVRAVHLESLTP